jgi:hypothetical protein
MGHIVIGLHPMLAYSALSGLCEHDLFEFKVANFKRAGSPERAVYINDGCSPSELTKEKKS